MKTQFNVSRMSKQTTAAHRGHHRDNILTASRHSRRKQQRTKYTYDPAGKRLTELVGGTTATSTYNALNQLDTTANAAINSRTNEWDAQGRLTALNQGNLRTEFAYDGFSRLASIRQLQKGSQVSFRRFDWSDDRICEERDMSGTNITKRFYPQGVVLETGTNAGAYYYTRDHLGSVRELTDNAGNVRARYTYDPYGRRTKISGDVDADFGFDGMFWSSEASLALTHFRAYDPNLGRWLSRDPLEFAEMTEHPNLYVYARNDPLNLTDRSGLAPSPLIQKEFWGWDGNQLQNFDNLAAFKHRNDSIQGTGDIQEVEGAEEIQEVESVNEFQEMNWAEADELFQYIEDGQFRAGGEIMEVMQDEEIAQLTQEAVLEKAPTPGLMQNLEEFAPIRKFPGFSGAVSEVAGAGLTILTMTDCNTANGILGLVRQGKGGMLNVYEDRLRKQLQREGLW